MFEMIVLVYKCAFDSQIIINKEPTKPPPDHRGWIHYNMKNSPEDGKEVWDVKRLLEVGRDRWKDISSK